MKNKKSWFSIQAKNDVAEVSIFDEIGGWGVSASDFKKDWDGIKDKKNIKVMLNSPGGSVFDGMTIYNIISSRRANVTVEVYGLAASIASVIALAGDRLIMGEGTYMMIHEPWAVSIGNSKDMLKMSELLDKMQGEFINIYETSSGLSRDEIKSAMEKETWYTAQEAQDAGFADEIYETEKVAACAFDFSKYGYAHVPAGMAANGKPKEAPETVREFEMFLREAGYSRAQAKEIASHGFQREAEKHDEGEQEENHLIDDGDYYNLMIEFMELKI